jgi:hypothetical protein
LYFGELTDNLTALIYKENTMLHSLIGLSLLCQGGDFQYSPHEEPPIAYFDVVPQQDVTGVFNMGVVAYHLEGVDRVEYTIHREGFEGDFNKDGMVDGEDISILFQNWHSDGGKTLARLLAYWGTATPIADEIVVVRDQTFNERTGEDEYWFGLDTKLYPDVKTTVTAEVFPVDGPSVVLDQDVVELADENSYYARPQYSGVNLFSNNYGQWPVVERYVSPNGSDETGDGTLENPYKNLSRALRHDGVGADLEVGGTIVYLMEGEHAFDRSGYCGQHWSTCSFRTADRYVTITPAPGVLRENAKIVSSEGGIGLSTIFTRFDNVYVESGQESIISASQRAIRWYDNSIVSGLEEDWWNGNYYKLSGIHGLQYWTDCTQKYVAEGHAGIIMRNMHMDYIQCDVLEMHWIQMALSVLITHHNENYEDFPTGCHTDYIQINGGQPTHKNIIFRDIFGNHLCQEQGVHACPGENGVEDIAWVNVELSNTGGLDLPRCNIPALIFRWCGPGKNNLFRNCMFHGKQDLQGGNNHTTAGYDKFNEDGSQNTEGPWALQADGSPRFKNVKFEDCWNDWDRTIPLFLKPDAGEPWNFYGPDELQFDSDTRDGMNENTFGPDEPWLSQITGIIYTQTE